MTTCIESQNNISQWLPAQHRESRSDSSIIRYQNLDTISGFSMLGATCLDYHSFTCIFHLKTVIYELVYISRVSLLACEALPRHIPSIENAEIVSRIWF